MRKTALSYAIAAAAGVVSFLAALNLRSVVLLICRANRIQWEISLINAVSVIVLMLIWIIYVFVTQYYFGRKCSAKNDYIRASLKFILPVVVMYVGTEILFFVIS